jgi:hypothetical protein
MSAMARPKGMARRPRRPGDEPGRVYVVMGGDPFAGVVGEDTGRAVPLAIFSSRELAEAFIGPEPGDLWIDDDFCLDAMAGYRQRRVYAASVGVDGEFRRGCPEGSLMIWADARERTPAVAYDSRAGVEARSAVSVDHALMAACDAWRERGGTVSGDA